MGAYRIMQTSSQKKLSVRERARLAKVWGGMSIKRLTAGLRLGFLEPAKCRDTLRQLEKDAKTSSKIDLSNEEKEYDCGRPL